MKCLVKVEYACEACGQVGEGQVELEWPQRPMTPTGVQARITGVGVPKGWREGRGLGRVGVGSTLLCADCLGGKGERDGG